MHKANKIRMSISFSLHYLDFVHFLASRSEGGVRESSLALLCSLAKTEKILTTELRTGLAPGDIYK
jgi:hypothetical protein